MKLKYLFLYLFVSFNGFSSFGKDRLVLVSASYGKNILAITDSNGDVLLVLQNGGKRKGTCGTP